jgi:hypothetical protein
VITDISGVLTSSWSPRLYGLPPGPAEPRHITAEAHQILLFYICALEEHQVLRAHIRSSAADNILQLPQQVFVLLACHARHEAFLLPSP